MSASHVLCWTGSVISIQMQVRHEEAFRREGSRRGDHRRARNELAGVGVGITKFHGVASFLELSLKFGILVSNPADRVE
eukprot:171447-Pyramimonas_sp.AAC.1